MKKARSSLLLIICAVLICGLKVEMADSAPHGSDDKVATSVPFATAKGLHSQLDVRGVYLIWDNETESSQSVQFDYKIYRSERGSAEPVSIPYVHGVIHTEEGERWSAVDTTIEWEKTYSYFVVPVSRVYGSGGGLVSEITGEKSSPIQVTTHDVFPPSAPERLLAIVTQRRGKNFVDLLWAPNAEKDISKYSVYRRQTNGDAVRINSVPGNILSFQDVNVSSAHTYFYSISAVDKNANESAKSQEATAVLR